MPHARLGLLTVAVAATSSLTGAAAAAAIDRRAVVARYPQLQAVDDASQLDMADVFSVGNGAFVFNVDATGLQTFNASFAATGPQLDLNILSDWGWHSLPARDDGTPESARAALSSFNWTTYRTAAGANSTRPVTLATDGNLTGPYAGWSMTNPHRMGLGQLSLRVLEPGAPPGADPVTPDPRSLTRINAALDTWGGSFASSFILSSGGTDPFCGKTGENGVLRLRCVDAGANISQIRFASYGAATGACPSWSVNPACNAANSTAIVTAACIGKAECAVPVDNALFGDPCLNTVKALVVVAHCSSGGGYQPSDGVTGTTTQIDTASPLLAASNSTFEVTTATTVHPDVDLVAVRLSCARLTGTAGCPTALRLAFSYSTGGWGPSGNDWNSEYVGRHTSAITVNNATRFVVLRTVDDTGYIVDCSWDDSAWIMVRTGPHAFALMPPAAATAAVVQVGGGGSVVCSIYEHSDILCRT